MICYATCNYRLQETLNRSASSLFQKFETGTGLFEEIMIIKLVEGAGAALKDAADEATNAEQEEKNSMSMTRF